MNAFLCVEWQYVLLINAPAIFPFLWSVTRSFVNQVGRRISTETEMKKLDVYDKPA
jgi:hypothetical protein